MSRILVGSTIPAFKMAGHWWHWLQNAEQITARATDAGHDVEWLAVLQHDARGRSPFASLTERFRELQAQGIAVAVRWFSLDVGEDEISTQNRLIAICTGRNLIVDHALYASHDWIYFADADIEAPDDVLPRLLELDTPVCGAHVPTYCLDGRAADFQDADAREHWNTAGSLLVRRDVFRRVPWRHDPDADDTDDPATQREMKKLGWPTIVRHDVICKHHPPSIGRLEWRGHDLAVYR